MQVRNNFKSGSCEMLILHILKNYGDSYAYQISQLIRELSDNELSFPEGSLYPAFYRMIEHGLISDYNKQGNSKMVRVYYHIEPAGAERLEYLLKEYRQTTENINRILAHKFN
ncbi:MAG: PadR family transcriptional regulator [Lachnospiraceae bacterium]|nr:PadR family transcriptional regulator [Lachnospiraceae bacterium]